ncbi:MAG: DUF3048 domain-containing protein [Litorilinea sp.]
MHRTSLTRFLVLLGTTAILLGCTAAASNPTPTPTKTPMAAAEAPPTATPIPVVLEPTSTPIPDVPPTPTPRPENIGPYTGLPSQFPELLTRRPVMICVNNDAVGRSAHYGLIYADIVYEYIVDGFAGTRITALYQSQNPDRVGPVRSARLPNLWMTYSYDGVLACSGGSDEIRYLLKNEVGFPYLDADIDDPSQNRYFSNIGTAYQTRMQASPDGVRRWLSDNNLVKEWDRPGFEFSDTPPDIHASETTNIQIAYPGGNQVEWRYDAAQNGYVRYQGGQPHVDDASGQPIVAQNVIVVVAEHTLTDIVEDSLGARSVDIQLYGFGDFRIFRDGRVYAGTWRADPENPPRWFGQGEAIVGLKPGQSWVQVVRQLSEVRY